MSLDELVIDLKEKTIKKNYEISQLMAKRDSYANKHFVVYKGKNEFKHYRYAISIGKKFGNAVKRNKMKRQIRSIIHDLSNNIKEDLDLFIVVKPKVRELEFAEIKKQLIHVLTSARIIIREEIS